jgi:hypothetical protein
MIMNGIRVTNILTWLIPFLVAIPFYTRDGALLVDAALFKSLVTVTGSVTAAALTIWFFSIVNGSYMREAVITGVCWLVLNRTLDALVLGVLMGMTPADYLSQTGLRYLMIPAMVIATGVVIYKDAVKKSPV